MTQLYTLAAETECFLLKQEKGVEKVRVWEVGMFQLMERVMGQRI